MSEENETYLERKGSFEAKIKDSFERKEIVEEAKIEDIFERKEIKFSSLNEFMDIVVKKKKIEISISKDQFIIIEIRGLSHKEYIKFESLKENKQSTFAILNGVTKPIFTEEHIESLPVDISNRIYAEILELSFLQSME